MSTITFNKSITAHHAERIPIFSFFSKFIDWSKNQQENRLMWLGLALAIHGCILAPVTIIAVMLAGNNLILFMLVMMAMGITLVTNLVALPTKITIPVFALSLLIDLAVLIICIVSGLGQSNIF